MKLAKSPTYYQALEVYMYVKRKGSRETLTIELVDQDRYSKELAHQGFRFPQQVTVVERGVLAKLTANELKMAIRIMDDLKKNNALWSCEPVNSYERLALKGLRDKKIIVKTEDPHIFFVNPIMIRNGSAASVSAQTAKLLETCSRVHKILIHDLSYNKVDFNGFDRLQLPMNDV